MATVIFLSAVSAEFHQKDSENPRSFESYRDMLSWALHRLGPDYVVVVQEELAQGFGDLLQTLDQEVQKSSMIVHLVGNATGSGPETASVRRLRERNPRLLAHEPELAESLGDFTGISYTQWEIYLAFHHRCNRLVFVAAKGAPRSPTFGMPEMAEEQVKHLERLKKTGEHREWFEDQRDLALKVITSIVRHGLAPLTAQREASEQAKEAGRKEAAQLVSEIAEGVRHPDRAYVSADDPAGVEVFLRAVDTAALKRELDRRAALEIAHEHRAKNCARQRQSRLRPRICASWLWLSLPWATIRRRSQRRNVRRRRPSKT